MKVALFVVLSFVSCTAKSFPLDEALRRGVTVTIGQAGCSGVIIATGQVLTAAHCKGEDMKVDGAPATVLLEDTDADLLLLKTQTERFRPLVIRTNPVGVADEVVAVFTYYELKNVVSFGRVAWVDEKMVVTDTKAAPGFSGSALYDRVGRLVGLNNQYSVAITPKGHGTITFACAVPAKKIQDFLRRVK